MSLIIAGMTPERVLLGVDTDAVLPDGTFRSVSKLLPMPHDGMVLAHSGNSGFLPMLAIHQELALNDYDGAVAAMPTVLRQVYDNALVPLVPADMRHLIMPQRIVLAGWSEALQRMAVVQWRVTADAVEPDKPFDEVDWLVTPPAPAGCPEPNTLADMKVIATGQKKRSVEEPEKVGHVGGRLIVAQMRKGRTVITDEGVF